MQKMLAAETPSGAGRIAHDNVLVKRKSTATGAIHSLIHRHAEPVRRDFLCQRTNMSMNDKTSKMPEAFLLAPQRAYCL